MDILFLAHRAPYPPDRGDKIRGYHILRHLAGQARVHLIAFAEDDADRVVPSDLAAELASATIVPRRKSQARAAIEALATGRPVSLAAFDAAAMRRAVRDLLGVQPIDAIYGFSGQMAQYLPAGDKRVVMDFVDVDSAKFAGFAKQGAAPMRWMMRREARLLGAFERDVAARVDASVFVSNAEAALFRSGGATGRIVAIENGIDAAHYDPARVTPVDADAPLLLFTGQMDYRPNVEAVCWFAHDVLPLIRATHPAATFAIVGRAPTAAVRALAGDHVQVTGAVDDVRPWLAAAAVCVAPLQLARGIQNKVLEAMAMARPVVASPAAAEGIDHVGTIRVGADAQGFAAEVAALLDAPAEAAAQGRLARMQVMARYAWPARLAPLDGLLGLTRRRVAA
ncbi:MULTISPECIES: TIGR03087 family PEP-CTERM/XrtA system glycosyltransferase [unclassified Sphingomonas]|jgi:polysaccharide biosynthesis protein PslH|uniref:TIGR03087 family PEP-CTERM/XrtA system glycosyltransferase n=1 Tax=unclassified Sphingomonas TaxID=196159 RepID=UPI000E101F15|nr:MULTISPECIES: TIGR03087 family PEP-CTERM/XrtA system glycosyltransferase [unclassified Sphingomonas]AXJ94263.1 TIGR03087 family PEP-CTERM/XrtA system glycosyltransferase [Sphingomonas sp. FARSPH]